MDVRKVYNYSEDRVFTLNLSERLPQYSKALDNFLKRLQEINPEIFDEYKDALKIKFHYLTSNVDISLETINIPKIQEKIKEYNELQKLYFTDAYHLLDIPEDYSFETIDLLMNSSSKSILYPRYYRALVLCEILGRETAIEYLKAFNIETRKEQIQNDPDLKLENLHQIVEEDVNSPSNANFYSFLFHEGKYGSRCDICPSVEVMNPIGDPELAYILFCYADAAFIESRNPSFVFTRTKTLMQGDLYCNACIHDKRFVTEIKHPDDEIYDSIEELLAL